MHSSLVVLTVVVFTAVQFRDALSACKADANCKHLICPHNGTNPVCNQGYCVCSNKPDCVDHCKAKGKNQTKCVGHCNRKLETRTCLAKCSADCGAATLATCTTKKSSAKCNPEGKKSEQIFPSCSAVKGAPTCAAPAEAVCGSDSLCACVNHACVAGQCREYLIECAFGCVLNATLILQTKGPVSVNGTLELDLPDDSS